MVIDQLKDTLGRWLKSLYKIKINVEAEEKKIKIEKIKMQMKVAVQKKINDEKKKMQMKGFVLLLLFKLIDFFWDIFRVR